MKQDVACAGPVVIHLGRRIAREALDMLGFARLTIRQAQEALRNGRLEDALRLLSQPAVRGHQRTWALLQQVVRGFVERGERQLRRDDPEGAWHDLLLAEQLDRHSQGAERLRQALVRLGLAEIRALLEAGEPGRAAAAAERLRGRAVRQAELQLLEDAARGWLTAREQRDRGELAQAVASLERVCQVLPAISPPLGQFRADLAGQVSPFAELVGQLHDATAAGRWREALEVADRILAAAPQHSEARKVRARAWKAVEPATIAMSVPIASVATAPDNADASLRRFLLWIDGVGGYLVCLAPRVTIGQATPDGAVDVPLLADISRLHAALSRDSEGYLLEALRPVQVNGSPVGKALLRANDRVTLGSSCQLQFRQPAPVSTSARLDLVSGHRFPLSVDGVLLMADTLLLGPGAQVHVAVPELKQPVVLFRQKDALALRWPGSFSIDGQRLQDRGTLTPRSTVSGEDLVFALEPI
jgi:hypothetical protein